MLNLRKVAVTGGLACGKSSVCLFLEQLGAYVVSADKIVHELLATDRDLIEEVRALLGEGVTHEETLSRSAIATKAFEDPALLLKLEELLHPRVFEEIERHHGAAAGHPLFVAEIPLLFETGAEKDYDATIAVVAEEEKALEWSDLSPEEYNRRASRQLPMAEKAKRADHVIKNTGTLDELRAAVEKVYNQLN